MIPKIIHYCWFGRKDKPEIIKRYINSWKINCPDYMIKEWNESNFDIKYNKYVAQAYEAKKYAFVSDVCRLYALCSEGGIYLDTDVEVLTNFDSFLNYHSFLGFEQNNRLLGTATIGAESHIQWVEDFLSIYDNIPFICDNGQYDLLPNTARLTNFFKNFVGIKPYIFSTDYFCAKDYKKGFILTTSNTVCIHHYAASWVEPFEFQKKEVEFWSLLGIKRNINISGKIYWRIIVPIKKMFNK